MKRAVKLKITGSMQSLFFREFIRNNAQANNVSGFLRLLEDGRVEVFLEGQNVDVEAMIKICKEGPKYSKIRTVEQSEERLQDFREFKILGF